MARGNDGQKIFLRQSDYQTFIEALRIVRQRYPFSLYAYVLMSNHFHLLLEEILVFNPDRTVEKRFLELLGPVAKGRFAFNQSLFPDAIKPLSGTLNLKQP